MNTEVKAECENCRKLLALIEANSGPWINEAFPLAELKEISARLQHRQGRRGSVRRIL